MASGVITSTLRLTYVEVDGTTDSSGNCAALGANIGLPVCFIPYNTSYDKLATVFVSKVTLGVYIHLSEWSDGSAIIGKQVKGKLYYIPI